MAYYKKREAISQWRKIASVPGANRASWPEPLTPIVFKGTGAYVVAGPESGQIYCFSAQDPEQVIDARDTDALLRTGLFQMNG